MATKKDFKAQTSAENRFRAQLNKIVKNIEMAAAEVKSPEDVKRFISKMHGYKSLLGPWAETIADETVARVKKINDKSWQGYSEIPRKFSKDLKAAINGPQFQQIQTGLREEVKTLIKSLPGDAAVRAQDLAFEAAMGGVRANKLVEDIQASGKVSKSRAKLIARTEIARATTIMTQTRAQSIGSDSYIWHSSKDGRVRDSHAAMNGKKVKWSDPPTLDGLTGHAGELPNCRCYPEPIIPDEPKFSPVMATRAEKEAFDNMEEVVQGVDERENVMLEPIPSKLKEEINTTPMLSDRINTQNAILRLSSVTTLAEYKQLRKEFENDLDSISANTQMFLARMQGNLENRENLMEKINRITQEQNDVSAVERVERLKEDMIEYDRYKINIERELHELAEYEKNPQNYKVPSISNLELPDITTDNTEDFSIFVGVSNALHTDIKTLSKEIDEAMSDQPLISGLKYSGPDYAGRFGSNKVPTAFKKDDNDSLELNNFADQFKQGLVSYSSYDYTKIRKSKKEMAVLDKGIQHMLDKGKGWDKGAVFRGVAMTPEQINELTSGAIINQKGTSSWTNDPGQAVSVTTKRIEDNRIPKEAVIFIENSTPKKNAISIANAAISSDQGEVLYHGNTQWEIVKVETKTHRSSNMFGHTDRPIHYIHVKEIPKDSNTKGEK